MMWDFLCKAGTASFTTLSGGEAQRIAGHGVEEEVPAGPSYPDEPTTGLHFEDVHVAEILHDWRTATRLSSKHNLDVIKTADYIIDMGPEGEHRGTVIAKGTPEEINQGETNPTPVTM